MKSMYLKEHSKQVELYIPNEKSLTMLLQTQLEFCLSLSSF